MDAWINEMTEVTGMTHPRLSFSLSDLSTPVPDARFLWIAVAVIASCFVAGCRETWFNDSQDRKSNPRRK